MKHWSGNFFRKFLFLIALGLFLCIMAAPAGAAGEQETIAVNFLKFLGSDKAIFAAEILEGNRLDPSLPPVTVGHLFHLDGGGYLLVSPDRSISPVKAYSLTGDFAALPAPYRQALLAELELRARVALAGVARAPLDAGMTETEKQWDFLLRLNEMRLPLAYTAGTYLLQTKWNQGYPYNKFLPAIGGNTVPVGCVNVAVAQVMRYYKYPASSKGVTSYTWDGPPSQTLKTILYRSYNWDNMPDTLDANTPEYQTDEVALLLKDLGIANQTNFDAAGSSTSIRSSVLTENFGYSNGLAAMDNQAGNYENFYNTIQSQIQAGQPVLLSFPGHMTVADGYVDDPTGRNVHVNMGWGGYKDNFYFLDRTDLVAGKYPTDAGNLDIQYNLKPCSENVVGDCAVNLEAGDAINGLTITGRFNQAEDTDLYEVYLNGPTTLTATKNRPYNSLYFFISLLKAEDNSVVAAIPATTMDNALVDSGSLPALGSFPEGKYVVRVSLVCDAVPCNPGSYYPLPDAAYQNYTITLSTGTVTAEQRANIDQALDRPPVIGNAFPDLLLNAAVPATRKILVDARDENGDPVLLSVKNSNPAAVDARWNGNLLELTPAGAAKISSRIVVTATANGKTTEKAFTVMTDDVETAFGKTFRVGGTFTGQNDVQTSRMILDGECTITGSTIGYDSQYFYSTLRKASGGTLFAAGTTAINSTFSRNRYLLDASLKQNPGGYGSYYPYQQGAGDQYLLSVSCPNADESTVTIAGILGIDLSGAIPPGDVNADLTVTLADAVLVMQMLSGMDITGKTIILQADANGDSRIGLAEVIFILQKAAGLRSP
jgi:hypothetical protein